MKLFKVCGALALVILLAAAKATVGVDFNDANLPQLQVDKSTLPETVTLLGTEPQSSQAGATGATAYTWQFVQSKAGMWTGKLATQQKRVVLVFNTDGTFQRILQMQGITLDAESHKRLFADPAAKAAPHVRAAQAAAATTP